VAAKGERQFICPDCSRRSVRLYLRPNGEDGYACVFQTWRRSVRAGRRKGCNFAFFTLGHATIDRENEARLVAANPDRDI